MKPIKELPEQELKRIKMIVFDVDGVLVPRGTRIRERGGTLTLSTKKIPAKEVEKIQRLHRRGFLINISSGRGLYMLQEMFREVLPFVSLTYECGSATWYRGKISQHINSFLPLHGLLPKLRKILSGSKNFKGFEPKEFIITVHCKKRDRRVEKAVREHGGLFTVWNGEAYDILVAGRQSKALGLRRVRKMFSLRKENVMAVGDNFNDVELLRESGTAVSADRKRTAGKYYVPQRNKPLPADAVMSSILGKQSTSKTGQKRKGNTES